MLPVLCIVGRSRPDVAAVIKGLLQELADKDVRVAVITQDDKGIPLDSISPDVARFVAAGSETVIVSAPGMVTTLRRMEEEPSLDELVWEMRDDYDLVLVDGFRHSSFPKVEIHHTSEDEELICHKNELLAIVGDKPAGMDIPTFDDNDFSGLAKLTRERFLVTEAGEDAALFIDGVRLPLALFVRKMVAGIVLGMVRTLKGVEDPKGVVVTVKTRK
jgi:molybdopterin-guanine dinucleotide biosynthesis protein MobB